MNLNPSRLKKFLSYQQRAALCINPLARQLLSLMAQKQTNLAVSLDVTAKAELLALADKLGPDICVLKTHIDIVEDFDEDLTRQLTQLAQRHHFLIFEDRKFADIGNTVQLQYAKGIYHIKDWAHIVNAHSLIGPGIIAGLKQVGLKQQRGLLLLAQMSPNGNLFNAEYTQATIAMAEAHSDFVMGFIALEKLSDNPNFIHFTPGVHQSNAGDALGQQYISPHEAIVERGTDIIIVGRGIYQADDPVAAAKSYKQAGWDAYLQRL